MSSTDAHEKLMAKLLPPDVVAESVKKLHNNFVYHAPTPAAQEKFVLLRTHLLGVAAAIDVLCPNSREKSVALTHIETAMMWANASVARNECPSEAPPQEKAP